MNRCCEERGDICRSCLQRLEDNLGFRPPDLHVASRYATCALTAQERQKLISRGIQMRSQRFSKSELAQIRRNLNEFVEKFEFREDPCLLLGFKHFKGDRYRLNKLRTETNFYFRLAKGLDKRPLYSVVVAARSLLDPHGKKGRFSEEEFRQLATLQKEFGNNWTLISDYIDRTRSSCRNKFYYTKEHYRKGRWTTSEKNRLSLALKKYVGEEKMADTQVNYPWQTISEFVYTRSYLQCRQFWFTTGCRRVNSEFDYVRWSPQNTASLIYLMHSNLVESEDYVDWNNLYKHFNGTTFSHVVLHIKWDKLKQKVPNHAEKGHEEIVLYLYHNHLPELLSKSKLQLEDMKSMLEN